MNFKKLFSSIILASALIVGIGVGVTALKQNKEAEPVAADYSDKDITDSTLEIRFTRPSDWGNNVPHVHTWNQGGSGTTWPGNAMTWLWDNEYGQAVFTWSPSSSAHLYGNIIFNNNGNGMQSDTLQSPTSSKAYWYDNGWKNGDAPTMDIFLYDYDNRFNGNVTVHAWRNGTNFANDTWPGLAATQLSSVATNGLIYKFTMNNRYDRVIFSNNGNNQTGDLTPTGNYCYVLANDDTTLSGKNTWWDNINYVFAHNFSQNTMLLRSVPTSDHSSTQYCSARYSAAKTHFNALMSSGYKDYVLNELNTNFVDAMTRLAAWARANGDSLNTSNGSLSKINVNPIFNNNQNDSIIIIVVIFSAIAVTAIGGYFFLRHRKEN